MAENIQEVFFVGAPDPPRLTYLSPVYEEMWGRSRQAIYDRAEAWIDTVHPEDRELAGEMFKRSFRGERTDIEYRSIRPDGSIRYLRIRSFPVLDSHGKFYRLVGIAEDRTDAKRVELEIMKAKDAAEAASRAKSDFLANMSHEIRTPMGGIIGMAEILLESKLTPQQEESLRLLLLSANSLMAVIGDILDLSKIEAGKLNLDNAVFNLPECLDAAAKTLAAPAQQKGLALSVRVAPKVPKVAVGDPLRLRQVLLNLLGNAIKFTKKGEIVLGVELESRKKSTAVLHFTVKDTGIGIPQDKQLLIFEAFSQADTSTTRKYGGTGLGLSIVSRLASLMLGNVWVESEVGEGSTFHFTASVGLPHDRLDPVRQSYGDGKVDGKFPLQAPSHAAALSKMAERRRSLQVLLADDNAINQRVIGHMLERKGHTVVFAGNGREAVDLLENLTFDVVLMDVQMPEMDGFSATGVIRQREKLQGRHTPILAVTAHTRVDELQRCLEAGMDGCVTKPVHEAELMAAMEDVMDAAHQREISIAKQQVQALDEDDVLERVGGDLDLLKTIVELFLQDCPVRVTNMREAVSRGDAKGWNPPHTP